MCMGLYVESEFESDFLNGLVMAETYTQYFVPWMSSRETQRRRKEDSKQVSPENCATCLVSPICVACEGLVSCSCLMIEWIPWLGL